jgi:hypothetical protein
MDLLKESYMSVKNLKATPLRMAFCKRKGNNSCKTTFKKQNGI